MSCILGPILPAPPFTLDLVVDNSEHLYTNGDHISGHVVLALEAPLIKDTQQVLPQYGGCNGNRSKSLTLGPKQYAFPFSIALPRACEYCTRDLDPFQEKNCEAGSPLTKSHEMPHLSRQLPPCTGDQSSSAEIIYMLKANVVAGGILKQSIQKSLRVFFCPLVSWQPPPQAISQRRAVVLSSRHASNKTASTTTTYQVTIELSRGAYLTPGQRVPINVYVTRAGPADHNLILNDYQAMLIEETVTRVAGLPRVQRLSRILRTMSNLDQPIYLSETPLGTTMCVSDDLWAGQSLPAAITPNFETCNIQRSYKLEIRLGLNSGLERAETRILEVQFPVYIVATASAYPLPAGPPVRPRWHETLPECVYWENMNN
ncbi:hypothetical protein BO78DRAFT_422542 [Aspergillus sclerotiicarbonarius CBS 121057]|uniref:Arrestin-like N-terminal domain-containing protein n=1 Tax=Aspergillus sclerotiicarbonarius (strain CBS 121057 / IBT 28362) TaxID=1448318 RepID=A0A319DXM5_ASPSB|nr:hypothetical protein BO78DRAFT_422542 [Aspergillus sclerotiicarbonarius CBS 121057]